MGDHFTIDQCNRMLEGRLDEFDAGVRRCVKVPMSASREAALVSFSYNVGLGAFCKSRLVSRLNAGDPNACDELLNWTRAGGIVFKGLVRRREAERDLCLDGV